MNYRRHLDRIYCINTLRHVKEQNNMFDDQSSIPVRVEVKCHVFFTFTPIKEEQFGVRVENKIKFIPCIAVLVYSYVLFINTVKHSKDEIQKTLLDEKEHALVFMCRYCQ